MNAEEGETKIPKLPVVILIKYVHFTLLLVYRYCMELYTVKSHWVYCHAVFGVKLCKNILCNFNALCGVKIRVCNGQT